MTKRTLSAALLLMAGAGTAVAQQNFDLFVPAETNETQATTPEARIARENRNSNGSPEFTLVGTSRIGNKVTAMLAHRDGTTVVVSSADGIQPIEGYTQFSVADIEGGQVRIHYPGNSPCMTFTDQGVHCDANGNVGELTLPNKAPLAPRMPELAEAEAATQDVVADGQTEEAVADPNNPFAAIQAAAARERGGRDAADNDNADAPPRAFQPRRIDPADVPPGMRIVSTPFGDRLVEDN